MNQFISPCMDPGVTWKQFRKQIYWDDIRDEKSQAEINYRLEKGSIKKLLIG